MSDNIVQWLNEIKTLREQLSSACQEREAAYTSATSWQKRYETEAQQRRTETQLMQQRIQDLQAKLEALQADGQLSRVDAPNRSTVEAGIRSLADIGQLQSQLINATLERDQLRQSLKVEQENHIRTRQHLTAAIGDAVDQLAKERELKSNESWKEG